MAKFEKNSDERLMFADFYHFCEEWYDCGEDIDHDYGKFCMATDAFAKKYRDKGPKMEILSRRLMCGYIDFMVEYHRHQMKNGEGTNG